MVSILRGALALIRTGGEPLAAGVSWGACSIGMTLLNKRAIQKTGAPLGVLILQMLATVLMALLQFRMLHFGRGTWLWASTVPVLFMCMMGSSMLALKHVSVGSFVVVRNLGPLVTLAMEVALHRPDNLTCNMRTAGATVTIAVGVWMYEANDIRWSQSGFFFLVANLGKYCRSSEKSEHSLPTCASRWAVRKPGTIGAPELKIHPLNAGAAQGCPREWSARSVHGLSGVVLSAGFACAERMLQRHLLHVREVDVSRTGAPCL